MKQRRSSTHTRKLPQRWLLLLLLFVGLLFGGLILFHNQRLEEFGWQGHTPYRWVSFREHDEAVYVIEYLPVGKTVVVVSIPTQLVMSTAGGYGEYMVGSLSALGKQEGWGDQLLHATLMQRLGISIRQVVHTETSHEELTSEGQLAIKDSTQILVASFFGQGPSLPEAVRLWWGIRRTDPGKRIDLSVSLNEVGMKGQDVDGMDRFIFQEDLWDRTWDGWHQRLIVTTAPVSVAIENTTDRAGLAATLGRIMARDGFEVVSVSDGRQALPRTLVMVEAPSFLDQPMVVGSRWFLAEADWRVGQTEEKRSQMIIRLGQRGLSEWVLSRL